MIALKKRPSLSSVQSRRAGRRGRPRIKAYHRPTRVLVIQLATMAEYTIEVGKTAVAPGVEEADTEDYLKYMCATPTPPPTTGGWETGEEVEMEELHSHLAELTVEVVSRDRDGFWVDNRKEEVDSQLWLDSLLRSKPQGEAKLSKQGGIEGVRKDVNGNYEEERTGDHTPVKWAAAYQPE